MADTDTELSGAFDDEAAGSLIVLGCLWSGAIAVLLFVTVRLVRSRAHRRRQRPTAARAQLQHAKVPVEASDTSQVSSKPQVSLKQLMKESRKQGPKSSVAQAVVSVQSPLCINTLKGHGDAVLGLDLSSNGSVLATVCQDLMLRVYVLEGDLERNLTYRYKKLSSAPIDVAIDPRSGHVLILSSEILDRAALTMYAPSGNGWEEKWRLHDVHQGSPGLALRSGGSNDASVFLSASAKQDMRLLDGSGRVLGRVDAAGLQTYDAALSGNGRLLAAATFTADVKVHEIKRDRAGVFMDVSKVNLDLKAHSRQVSCVAFSPDSLRAVTASKDGTWAVWNLAVRYHLKEDPRKLTQQPQEVPAGQCFSRLAYGPDNIVAACFGSALQFLDAISGNVLETVEDAHEGIITAVQWKPGSLEVGSQHQQVLVTASLDKRVRLWRCPQR